MQKKVFVIGAGPAGMMAAIQAALGDAEVHLFEKKHRLGLKLLISGGGRCNITNVMEVRPFINQFGKNGKFLYNAFHRFFRDELLDFFRNAGVKFKEERGGRIFPESDKSSEILGVLMDKMNRAGVIIHLSSPVSEVLMEGGKVVGIRIETKKMFVDKVIVATGGMSYPKTGSTGDGFKFAEKLGIPTTAIYPALVPLIVKEKYVKELQGLSLKNIKTTFLKRDKKICDEFGEMVFTDYGVSGPIILSQSKKVVEALVHGNVKMEIDLKPALDDKKLDERLIRDLNSYGKKLYKNFLRGLLPKSLIPVFAKLSGIPDEKSCHQIGKKDRKRIFTLLRRFPFTVVAYRPIDEALVTVGGIDLSQVNPKTMESKKIAGLYFCGEVLDLDGDCGGFNLQAAFSTGFVAGVDAAKN